MSEPSASALLRALELARALAGSRDPDAILESILDSAIELTGAKRGFVVVAADGALAVRAARHYGRRGVPSAEARTSLSLVRRALDSGVTLVSGSALDDAQLASGASVRELRLRSVAVAPLVARGEPLGAVVVEDRERSRAFGDSERRLLELVSGHAALALDAARTRAALEERLAHSESERIALERTLARARSKGARFERLVGTSAALEKLKDRLERCCASDLPVLIEGESGSGKELVARTLHESGPRRARPFVAINVTELPESLLEAELFGHRRGAFTGAHADRPGLVREAQGGTLFLDEIGDTPPALQAKLLRVLQEREVRPLGGASAIPVDVRFVTATNKDLRALVAKGAFREDLYFRLKVLMVEVPPLRARRDDVTQLASHFLWTIAREQDARPRRLSREAIAALERHGWPGNVRELENAIRRAVAIGGDVLVPEDLGLDEKPAGRALDLAGIERAAAERALADANGRVARAAAQLGIHRATLYRKLREWGIRA